MSREELLLRFRTARDQIAARIATLAATLDLPPDPAAMPPG
jgi:hypothetical protein